MTHFRFSPGDADLVLQDERILWQGRPLASGLIWRAFPLRLLIAYFAVLAVWTTVLGTHEGLSFDAVAALLRRGALGAIFVFGLIAAAALLIAASTRYVITDHRIVFQIGMALPIALTLPLAKITSVDLKLYRDGSGDIPLTLGSEKLAYLLLWPHARPWRFASPQPMLRTVPCARDVATVLADALQATRHS